MIVTHSSSSIILTLFSRLVVIPVFPHFFIYIYIFFYEDANVGKCKVTEVEVKAEEAAEDNLKIKMSLHSYCRKEETCHMHLNRQGWSLELDSASET